jgi:hypothetical protein
LRAAGSFDYLRDRLQAQEADTATVGSPFDYKGSTLLCLPADVPEPNAPGYQTAVEQAIIGLARAMQGRTLVLFTSNAQMKRTAQAIAPALTEAGITTLTQGSGGSRHQLLESFKSSERTVLLGTRSFWEGVEPWGRPSALSACPRCPRRPDRRRAARPSTIRLHHQVPDAILRFRQGWPPHPQQDDRGVALRRQGIIADTGGTSGFAGTHGLPRHSRCAPAQAGGQPIACTRHRRYPAPSLATDKEPEETVRADDRLDRQPVLVRRTMMMSALPGQVISSTSTPQTNTALRFHDILMLLDHLLHLSAAAIGRRAGSDSSHPGIACRTTADEVRLRCEPSSETRKGRRV